MQKEFMLSAIFKKEAEQNLKEACELYIESAKEVGMIEKVLEEINGQTNV